jgi:hypothetical protein
VTRCCHQPSTSGRCGTPESFAHIRGTGAAAAHIKPQPLVYAPDSVRMPGFDLAVTMAKAPTIASCCLQGGELLHSTSNSAARHLSQDSQDSATSEAGDDQATTVQQGARLSARMASGTPGDRDDPAMTGDDSSLGQLRMNGTPTGRGVRPTRITVEGFYASRDLEVRPGVGGDIRMEGTTMPTIRPGPYTRQQVRSSGPAVGDSPSFGIVHSL